MTQAKPDGEGPHADDEPGSKPDADEVHRVGDADQSEQDDEVDD